MSLTIQCLKTVLLTSTKEDKERLVEDFLPDVSMKTLERAVSLYRKKINIGCDKLLKLLGVGSGRYFGVVGKAIKHNLEYMYVDIDIAEPIVSYVCHEEPIHTHIYWPTNGNWVSTYTKLLSDQRLIGKFIISNDDIDTFINLFKTHDWDTMKKLFTKT